MNYFGETHFGVRDDSP